MSPLSKKNNEMKRHTGIKASRAIGNTFSYIILVLISIVWLVPFFLLVCQSFRCDVGPTGEALKGITNSPFPEIWGWDNYVYLFSAECNFIQWYFNTFIIALFVAVGQSVFALSMAYVLSRFRFKMRKFLMNMMLILGMFPGFLTLIILYFVLKTLGLTQANAVPGLILVSIASSGMGYYVAKGFFDTIPKSLDEAAKIDGANRAQIFLKIILPLAKPIVIYTILTAFMGPWGDFMFARYISFGASDGYNVAVGLWSWLQKDQIGSHFTYFCTGGVVVSIPVITLFLFLQRYYVEGVTGGAVKG